MTTSNRPGFWRWGNVGSQEDIPDWWRMYLIPRNRLFNVYLHRYGPKFRDKRMWGLHDHPWSSLSIRLRGRLLEFYHPIKDGIVNTEDQVMRVVPRICYRPAHWSHALTADASITYTLFLTGRFRRAWGFWNPRPGPAGGHDWIDAVTARWHEERIRRQR